MSAASPAGGAVTLGPGSAVVAVDVGGTTVKAAYVDGSGRIGRVVRRPSPPRGPGSAEALLSLVAETVTELAATVAEPPQAVGLALPGIVDEETGTGRLSENLGWHDVDFRTLAASHLRLPCAITHDVRAAGQAEMVLGAGRGHSTVLVVVIGTGVSGAVFVDGRRHVAHGYAGEIGHAVVVRDGEPCLCGGRGCLEATASAAAIVRRYEKRTGRPVTGAKEVLDRARQGDVDATEVWDTAVDALALGLSHAVCLLAPDAVVVGGGLSEAGEDLLGPLRRRLDQLLTLHPSPRLVGAQTGEDAGLVGAALAARELAC